MQESVEQYVNRLLATAEPEHRVSAYRRGETHPRSKLSSACVLEIRRRASAGASPAMLAAEFGVTPSAIHGVIARRTWRHVEDLPAAAAVGRDTTEQGEIR